MSAGRSSVKLPVPAGEEPDPTRVSYPVIAPAELGQEWSSISWSKLVAAIATVVDVDEDLLARIDAVLSGRLGYAWYYAINISQDFGEGDFLNLVHGRKSEFPEIETPAVLTYPTYFGAVAIPLNEPDAFVNQGSGFSALELLDGPHIYRRIELPSFIDGLPHKVYVSRQYLTTYDSERELTLVPRPRLSRYPRYAIGSAGAAVPAFGDAWAKSNGPVVAMEDFAGAQFIHFLLPHTTEVPDPTYVAAAVEGAVNVVAQFTEGGLVMVGTDVFRSWSSQVPLAEATYAGRGLIILPEREGISYYEAPTVVPDADVGFTWYMGFYTWARNGNHPATPVTAALVDAGVEWRARRRSRS